MIDVVVVLLQAKQVLSRAYRRRGHATSIDSEILSVTIYNTC